MLLKLRYRLPLNFTDELFNEANIVDKKINDVLKQANLQIQLGNLEVGKIKIDERINEIMDEDFNTPNLLSYLMELVKDLNSALRNKEDITISYDKINLINTILGLKYDLKELTTEDKELYQKWLSYKETKDFSNADKIREELVAKNIL